MARDHHREWVLSKKKYDSKPSVKAKRNSRKRARYKLEKEGRVKRNDGRDVDHKDRNANNNARSNLRVRSRKANRGWSKGLSLKEKK